MIKYISYILSSRQTKSCNQQLHLNTKGLLNKPCDTHASRLHKCLTPTERNKFQANTQQNMTSAFVKDSSSVLSQNFMPYSVHLVFTACSIRPTLHGHIHIMYEYCRKILRYLIKSKPLLLYLFCLKKDGGSEIWEKPYLIAAVRIFSGVGDSSSFSFGSR